MMLTYHISHEKFFSTALYVHGRSGVKTKPEQNMHQNVPNDTIFNPAKQVHSNNNYFHMKIIIFLYKIEQKNTPKHINCHMFSIIFRKAYVRHSKYIDAIYTDLFNIKIKFCRVWPNQFEI